MFDSKELLDQLIKVGSNMLQHAEHKEPEKTEQNTEAGGVNMNNLDPVLKGLLTGIGGGMLGSMLSGKSNALTKLGGSAALATLAYRAYHNYMMNNGKSGGLVDTIKGMMNQDKIAESQSFEVPKEATITSVDNAKAVLIAIINVAKADNVFTETEREGIAKAVEKFSSDPTTIAWVKEELAKPINVNELAEMAGTPQVAVEIYLASLAACRSPNEKEQAYLEDLRKALHIDSELKDSIEQQLFS